MSEEEKEEELVLTNDEYYQYLLDNYYSCLDKEKIKRMPKKDKVVDPEVVKIGNLEITVKNYNFHRINRILKKYFGNPEKGGYYLKKRTGYKQGRYGRKIHYKVIDKATGNIVVESVTLRELRVYLSGIARTGFPLDDMYDQIFEFRLMSWQEHGYPDFPA